MMTFLLTWSIFVRMSFDLSAVDEKENAMSTRGPNDNDKESSSVNARMLALSLTPVMQCAFPENNHSPHPPPPPPTERSEFPGVAGGGSVIPQYFKKCM